MVDDTVVASGGDGTVGPSPALVDTACELLWTGPAPTRFVVVHGLVPLLRDRGVDDAEAMLATRSFRRSMCDAVARRLLVACPEAVNPADIVLEPIEYDIDGFGINENFMGGSIDFSSTKTAHFDIVEPISSNLYGYNAAVTGGFPTFADGRSYCAEHDIDIRSVLRKIPGTRNLTFAPGHYENLLADYAVTVLLDMVTDAPFTIVLNRVLEAGLLHGASAVEVDGDESAVRRPISHYAWDNVTDEAAADWYRSLNQDPHPVAGSSADPKPFLPVGRHIDVPVLHIS